MISLLYLLVYFANGELKWLKDLNKEDSSYYQRVAQRKNQITSHEVCCDQANFLINFAKNVLSLEFTEKPHYSKLKFYLVEALLDQGKAPNQRYDWTDRKSLPPQTTTKEDDSEEGNEMNLDENSKVDQ